VESEDDSNVAFESSDEDWTWDDYPAHHDNHQHQRPRGLRHAAAAAAVASGSTEKGSSLDAHAALSHAPQSGPTEPLGK
jgi:hypothetical protein